MESPIKLMFHLDYVIRQVWKPLITMIQLMNEDKVLYYVRYLNDG